MLCHILQGYQNNLLAIQLLLFFFLFFLRELETETLFQQNKKHNREKILCFNSFSLNIKKKRIRIQKRFENITSNQAQEKRKINCSYV